MRQLDELLDRPGAISRSFLSSYGNRSYEVGCIPWGNNRIDGQVYFLFIRRPDDPPNMLIHGEIRKAYGGEGAEDLLNEIVQNWSGRLA